MKKSLYSCKKFENMNEINTFNSCEFGEMRTYSDPRTGEIWFCLNDVCKALEIANSSNVKATLIDKGIKTLDVRELSSSLHTMEETVGNTDRTSKPNLGGNPNMTFIDEGNLYQVIFQSRKPNAAKFKEWVCYEVLPSIRKNGIYAEDDIIEKFCENPQFGIDILTRLKKEKEEKRLLAQKIENDKPKVYFADTMMNSNSSILIGELSVYLTQNGYSIGQKTLFKWMRDNGYLYEKGEMYNLPVQKYVDLGYFKVKKSSYINKKTQEVVAVSTVKVTGKGQVYFLNLFRGIQERKTNRS